MHERAVGPAVIRVVRGDITAQEVDAIVNAANRTLLGGGGVDGAIHRNGGPEILAACREIRRTRYPDGLPTGAAVSTTAGLLPARWVIHTVGPIWRGGSAGEPKLLASAYRSVMTEARALGARALAFPSISTGAYGYPLREAAPIAVSVLVAELEAGAGRFSELRLVAFDGEVEAVYAEVLAELER